VIGQSIDEADASCMVDDEPRFRFLLLAFDLWLRLDCCCIADVPEQSATKIVLETSLATGDCEDRLRQEDIGAIVGSRMMNRGVESFSTSPIPVNV
jgi:hypothetical protein